MLGALGWGSLAAVSLVVGALLAFARPWSDRQVGLVLAFGAGALISAVSFELAEEGIDGRRPRVDRAGLAAGAITYFTLDGVIARRGGERARAAGRRAGANAGTALALGRVPRRRARAGRARYRARLRGGRRRRACSSRSSCRTCRRRSAARVDMHDAGAPRARILRLWVGGRGGLRRSRPSPATAHRRCRDRRGPRGDRRIRRGRAARHAHRLDDPRGAQRRGTGRRARDDARLRRRRGPVEPVLSQQPPMIVDESLLPARSRVDRRRTPAGWTPSKAADRRWAVIGGGGFAARIGGLGLRPALTS